MKDKRIKPIKITLCALYGLLFLITIISWIRGGFAKTANGITIPDSWIFYSFINFAVFTAVQAVVYHVGKDVGGRWLYITSILLAAFKCASVVISELIIDNYVFNPNFINSGNASDFQAGVWYTMLVIFFLVATVAVMIMEIIGSVKLSKIQPAEESENAEDGQV